MKTNKKEIESPSNLNNTQPHSTATTMEGRENELSALAYDAAEKRIREGTASSAEIVHFLKLGSSKERLEKENLSAETELKKAKISSIHQAEHAEEAYQKAIAAMQLYSGYKGE